MTSNEPVGRESGVVQHSFTVDRAAREALGGHGGSVLWFTGLPGSGKSSIADEVERQLHGKGLRTFVLDGDSVRTGLCKDLGFSPEDRAENVRRVSEVARLMVDAGIIVLVCLVSPFAADRRAARKLFADGEFLEVFVDTPLPVCIERDPKGLYAKSAAGDLPTMSGVGQNYEVPDRPDVHVDGRQPIRHSAAAVIDRLGPISQFD